jgi:hypothetical protein
VLFLLAGGDDDDGGSVQQLAVSRAVFILGSVHLD